MDLAQSIEKHFHASTTLFSSNWKEVENLITKGLSELGFSIIKTNYKTPFGEVDLLASFSNYVFMIEIKAVSEIDLLDRINRSGQKKRLVKIYKYLENYKNLRSMLIVVERNKKEVLVFLDYLNEEE